jgi:hypothetical protein
VTSDTSDGSAPVVGSVSVSPGSVDVSSGSAEVTVQMAVTDDLSGVRYVEAWFGGPGGAGLGVSFQRVSGTVRDGVWSGVVTVPRYSKPGVWSLAGLMVSDEVGNVLTMETPEQIAGLTGSTSFTVTSGG